MDETTTEQTNSMEPALDETAIDSVTQFFVSNDFLVIGLIPVVLLALALLAILFFRWKGQKQQQELFQEFEATKPAASDLKSPPLAESDEKQTWELPSKEKTTASDETPAEPPETWVLPDIEDSTSPDELVPVERQQERPPSEVEEIQALTHQSWISKLRSGLSKTRSQLGANLRKALTGKVSLDDDTTEELQHLLYKADVGVQTSDRLVEAMQRALSTGEANDFASIKKCLANLLKDIFNTVNQPFSPVEPGPTVILVIGVNGVGKTTSIGKLTAHFRSQGKSVLLCAADTFRAAAIDQLKIWGQRLEVDVIAHQPGADPAAVAYDAVKAAKARKYDYLLIDTAGRLHNKEDLMQELGKINRIIGRDLPGAPHETWIVVDATTGQNAFLQVKAFQEVAKVTGLILTKLDGTAKGGVAIGLTDQFKLPIRYIGVGEKASDLHIFSSADYISSLLDEENES
jgi:fused signal recognition particle receptor